MALTVPNTFVAGTTAVASEVNDNFVAVKVFVDGLETDVAALEIKSPVITLAGDLTGSATLTNLGNATLTATIAANSVALGTDTTGNYVSNVAGGTGITVTHTPGEGSTPTVAVTANTYDAFGAASTAATNAATALSNHESDTTNIHGIADTSILVTTSGTQTLTNKTLTSPTITGVSPVVTLSGDVTGSATLTNLGSATITTTIAANSVALGADTTGNYVSTITAGTGITGSASSESATPTIAIDAGVVPQLGVANTFTTNQVIAASSTSDLLRITQTGTGNALVVEDEANPDSTPFVVSANGFVGIGVASPTVKLDVAGSTTVGTQTNVAAAFGAVSTGRLLVGSINGNGPFIGSESTDPLVFTTNGVVRMRINSAGEVGIGTSAATGRNLIVGKAITGSTSAFGIVVNGAIQSDVTGAVQVVRSGVSTAAASFTLPSLTNFYVAGIATPGAGSAITNQYGFFVDSSLTGATSNFAFYGDIPAGTGRANLYMGGTASNYMAGRLGVGATLTSGAMAQIVNTTAADIGLIVRGAASQTGNLQEWRNSAGTALVTIDSAGAVSIGSTQAATSLNLTKNISGSVNSQALRIASPIASGVTGEARYVSIVPSVDASVAAGNVVGTKVFGATLGAGASITTQYGFWAASDITAATTNYGFYGDIASASGRWNLYMNGTAANYLAGRLGVGATLTSGAMTQFTNTTAADKVLVVKGATSQTGYLTDWQNTSGTSLAYVDSSGNAKFVSIDGGSA